MNNGGNGLSAKECEVKQELYAQARLSGSRPKEARDLSGYSETTKIKQIERPGGAVAVKMYTAIEKKLKESGYEGTPEEYLAEKTLVGVDSAKLGKAFDGAGHARHLLQLSWLIGQGQNKTPGVAVQINNGGAVGNSPGKDEPGRVEDALRQVEGLLGRVAQKLGLEERSDILPGDNGDVDPGSHPGVAGLVVDGEETPGGGES